MNKILNFFLALLAFSLLATISGCVKDDEAPIEQEDLHKVIFHAGWAPETKTSLQEDGGINWSPNDSIGLFTQDGHGSGTYCKLVSTNTSAAPNADFAVAEGSFPKNASTFYAIYPYRFIENWLRPAANENDKIGINITIPTVQTAIPGSFDPHAFVSFAVSNNNNLYFHNLCGGVKFSVSQEGITEVSFRYGSGNAMSGQLELTFDGGDIPFKSRDKDPSDLDMVIVRAPNNSTFEAGKYYYAVMYPSANDSLVVSYKKGSLPPVYLTTGRSSIKRSVFKRLYNLDSNLPVTKIDAPMLSILPDYMRTDETIKKITEVYFHPLSNHETNVNLGTTDRPVYFELSGTIVHYYTPLDCINIKDVAFNMFGGWNSLTKVDFTGVKTSDVTNFYGFFSGCDNLRYINFCDFNTSNAVNMNDMFHGCHNLESLDLSTFNTSHVTNMENMFADCRNLRELDLSSFDTKNCVNMSCMFNYCVSLQKLDLSGFDVSAVSNSMFMCDYFAIHRKHCVVRASDATKTLMCGQDANMPQWSKDYYILWIDSGDEFPIINDPFAALYKSTDYSKDMTFSKKQTATKGKGIDIVIMGDAYSDRLIANGTYDSDLGNAIEQIFSEEPLKSLRDYFNVYITYAVSENETYEGITALDLIFEDGLSTNMEGGGPIVDDYLRATLPNYGMEWQTGRPRPFTILVSNTKRHAGKCRFWSTGDADVYSALGIDNEDFHHIICHEFGHAIGKLADEYEGIFTFNDYDKFNQDGTNGFWPNVDITSNPNSVKWHHFLTDSRYSNQGLGVFEGGFADYAYGIWRSTENSIMNTAVSGFNAPCREAIYKRVHELADDSFVYDYETFVAFDQPSWTNNVSVSNNAVRMNNKRRTLPLPPPVFVKGGHNYNSASKTVR